MRSVIWLRQTALPPGTLLQKTERLPMINDLPSKKNTSSSPLPTLSLAHPPHKFLGEGPGVRAIRIYPLNQSSKQTKMPL